MYKKIPVETVFCPADTKSTVTNRNPAPFGLISLDWFE